MLSIKWIVALFFIFQFSFAHRNKDNENKNNDNNNGKNNNKNNKNSQNYQESLSMLTFNTALIPSSEYFNERKPVIIETLNNYDADIICLQELFSPIDMYDILQQTQEQFPYQFSSIVPYNEDILTTPCEGQSQANLYSLLTCMAVNNCNFDQGTSVWATCVLTYCFNDVLLNDGTSCQYCWLMNYISDNNATSAFTECSMPSHYDWNENGGVVILSKVQGNLVINEEIIQPIGEGRTVIGFQIDDENYTLFNNSVILCTHLSTVYVDPNETTVVIDNGTAIFTTSTELIQNQVEEIISTLDDYDDYNQFIMGDFNAGPDEVPDAYYIAIDEGYKNVFEYNEEFEELWECTYCGKYPDYIYHNELSGNQTSKLDHILYKRGNKKNNIQVKSVEIEFRQDEIDVEVEDGDDNSIPLSDHYGVYAEFVITNKKAKRWIYHYWARQSSSSSSSD